jgi:uncharacterized membrane protein YfcA
MHLLAESSSQAGILLIAALIGAVAGVVRGITGFGGAMVMAPPLALILGPKVTVPVVLLLESLVAAPQVLQTRKLVRWRLMGPMLAATCLTVPFGGYLLLTTDALTLRRVTALIVIVFSLLLLRGWRYRGQQRAATGVGLGGLAGAMLGATSIGGPPVILYLLASPDRIEVTRANLTLFVAGSSLVGIAMLIASGVLDVQAAWTGLLLAPGYYGGLVVGSRLFSRFNDARFRQFTLLLMIAVSAGILLA